MTDRGRSRLDAVDGRGAAATFTATDGEAGGPETDRIDPERTMPAGSLGRARFVVLVDDGRREEAIEADRLMDEVDRAREAMLELELADERAEKDEERLSGRAASGLSLM